MRVIVQRVSEAAVSVGGSLSGRIGAGLLVLAGFEDADQDGDLDWMVQKLLRLRIFADDAGVMNRSVTETGGEILAVSQFTLYASTRQPAVLGARRAWRGFAAAVRALSRPPRGGAGPPRGQRRFRRRHAGQPGE